MNFSNGRSRCGRRILVLFVILYRLSPVTSSDGCQTSTAIVNFRFPERSNDQLLSVMDTNTKKTFEEQAFMHLYEVEELLDLSPSQLEVKELAVDSQAILKQGDKSSLFVAMSVLGCLRKAEDLTFNGFVDGAFNEYVDGFTNRLSSSSVYFSEMLNGSDEDLEVEEDNSGGGGDTLSDDSVLISVGLVCVTLILCTLLLILARTTNSGKQFQFKSCPSEASVGNNVKEEERSPGVIKSIRRTLRRKPSNISNASAVADLSLPSDFPAAHNYCARSVDSSSMEAPSDAVPVRVLHSERKSGEDGSVVQLDEENGGTVIADVTGGTVASSDLSAYDYKKANFGVSHEEESHTTTDISLNHYDANEIRRVQPLVKTAGTHRSLANTPLRMSRRELSPEARSLSPQTRSPSVRRIKQIAAPARDRSPSARSGRSAKSIDTRSTVKSFRSTRSNRSLKSCTPSEKTIQLDYNLKPVQYSFQVGSAPASPTQTPCSSKTESPKLLGSTVPVVQHPFSSSPTSENTDTNAPKDVYHSPKMNDSSKSPSSPLPSPSASPKLIRLKPHSQASSTRIRSRSMEPRLGSPSNNMRARSHSLNPRPSHEELFPTGIVPDINNKRELMAASIDKWMKTTGSNRLHRLSDESKNSSIPAPPPICRVESAGSASTCTQSSKQRLLSQNKSSTMNLPYKSLPYLPPSSDLMTNDLMSVISNVSKEIDKLSAAEEYTFEHQQYDIEIPRGPLRVIIDCGGHTGWRPALHQIKKTSPLFDLTKPGDIITSIDGLNTKMMSAEKIAKLVKRYDRDNEHAKPTICQLKILSKEGNRSAI
mmetsp:Transcript_22127/g.28438  ORF Transcript_22127/g.28438 Transcript_22127/m.28438 type:complete len:820 (-) Transcript_22127:238-2697(-)|eukprot:CAMPEP_0116052154 /NCGR_PEP_ID=MMETSP0322-20121206/1397_1 /TAXON_ID=163516 /ORGANISM="Leptocylindrus danicus var. apora, Strain B651" /LENGTH=819 /DNA_ID=CAMNT_0003535021 /DNA_START=50 /DNA_END=2509 /DNA_ORIENTATION=-